MNRRNFGKLGACSALAMSAALGLAKPARAGVSAAQAAQLKTTLTPMGSPRAGNADGTIPAWTGGLTQTLAGWTPDQPQPDYFASDAPVVVIDQSNMAQHQDRLTDGLQKMIAKYGFSIKVFPTHRTAAMPQWVYDNIYQNALNSSLDPRGGRFGFAGAYGGIPFPILDSDPGTAGAQAIWNHITRWDGQFNSGHSATYVINNGTVTLTGLYTLKSAYPYYQQENSLTDFNGWLEYQRLDYIEPAVLVGQVLAAWYSTNGLDRPTQAWELLNGQGRVRKAPELTFDTPQSTGGGISNYDEGFGFNGSPIRYDWKLLGIKEMYVPYNNNALSLADPAKVLLPHFVDPDVVRFELHRVYVVDATLAPGERHSVPHRRFYIDEDNWHVVLADEWDAGGNFIKTLQIHSLAAPELPGTIYLNGLTANLQNDQYTLGPGVFAQNGGGGITFNPLPTQFFNPQSLAAQSQY